VVYHNELKHLNRIKEFKWGHIYQHILSDVRMNAVALFMVELLTKCLKQQKATRTFHFVEDIFMKLDESSHAEMANLPLFFALHLPYHFGFRITDNYSEEEPFLDLQEGKFVAEQPRPSTFPGR
jgi:DNA repair protein RecO (recombination protein O)